MMKTKTFSVRIPLALAVTLERKAEQESLTIADLIRKALTDSINQERSLDILNAHLTGLKSQIDSVLELQSRVLLKLTEFEVAVNRTVKLSQMTE